MDKASAGRSEISDRQNMSKQPFKIISPLKLQLVFFKIQINTTSNAAFWDDVTMCVGVRLNPITSLFITVQWPSDCPGIEEALGWRCVAFAWHPGICIRTSRLGFDQKSWYLILRMLEDVRRCLKDAFDLLIVYNCMTGMTRMLGLFELLSPGPFCLESRRYRAVQVEICVGSERSKSTNRDEYCKKSQNEK